MGSHSGELVKVTIVEGGRNFYKGFFVKVNLKQALEEERLHSRVWVRAGPGREAGSPGRSNQVGVVEQSCELGLWSR